MLGTRGPAEAGCEVIAARTRNHPTLVPKAKLRIYKKNTLGKKASASCEPVGSLACLRQMRAIIAALKLAGVSAFGLSLVASDSAARRVNTSFTMLGNTS
jgi:hypothetical protein